MEITFRHSAAELLRSMLCGPPPVESADTPANAPKLLTARDAAKALAVCEKTLWNLTERGEISAVRIGRSVRYDPADLTRWVERSKSAGK